MCIFILFEDYLHEDMEPFLNLVSFIKSVGKKGTIVFKAGFIF